MVILEELWVGDAVRIIATGETGKFHSHANGMATILLDTGSRRQLSAAQLELYEPKEVEDALDLNLEEPEKASLSFHNFPSSIDLHIDKLNPSMANARPERILSYQSEAIREYLNNAESVGLKFVTIIHGKGTGVLKAETLHILKTNENVNYIVEVKDGGAVEVWLK